MRFKCKFKYYISGTNKTPRCSETVTKGALSQYVFDTVTQW